MTGFGRGSASVNDSGVTSQVTVEVKSVNNRFLKVATRLPDLLSEMESEIESQVRGKLSRGSVYCLVQLEHPGADGRFQLNTDLLREWHPRLAELARDLKTEAPSLASMLAMDGVVNELRDSGEATDALKAAVLKALGDALAGLLDMRLREGAALRADLDMRVKKVAALAKQVESRAPQVVQEYRDKLKARIEKLLADSGVAVDDAALAREVAHFSDRCDITEETTRLEHHCVQFLKIIGGEGDVGRRLDFIAQEMLRETNTIGSKANDAQLASTVVEMKSEIERVKEQVQNLE